MPWNTYKLARHLKKDPDGFSHTVRDNARHLLRRFSEDEVVRIFCNLQVINETEDGSTASRLGIGDKSLDESGDAVVGQATTKIFCAPETGKNFEERQSVLPTQYDPARPRVNPHVMSSGVADNPLDSACGDKLSMQCDTLSEVETRQNEVKTPEKSVESLTSRRDIDMTRNLSGTLGQVA